MNLEADFLLSAQILITQFLNVSSPNFIALTKSNCVEINTLTLIKKKIIFKQRWKRIPNNYCYHFNIIMLIDRAA